MGKMVIMRGVSGSGKSTKAAEIVEDFREQTIGGRAIVCSADQFFVDEHGKYRFDPKLLSAAHTYCRARAETAAELNADLIIIDNTNTRKWEFSSYEKIAEKYGYNVQFEVVGDISNESLEIYAGRNTHGLGIKEIKAQADRFEL